MRCWHIKLLPLLPRQQLLSQLRECVAIAKDIYETGKTNHILINPIMDYPIEHFQLYCDMVIEEMNKRRYVVSNQTYEKFNKYISLEDFNVAHSISSDYSDVKLFMSGEAIQLFSGWHDTTYLVICLYNLYEKYLRGGVTFDEWDKIYHKFYKYLDY